MFSDIASVWKAYSEVGGRWTRYDWTADEIDLDTLEVKRGPWL